MLIKFYQQEGDYMFDKAKIVKIILGDPHLGEGLKSLNEDFKYHPQGVPMKDTSKDYLLDKVFAALLDWVLKNTRHCSEVQLYLLGDIVDFSAIHLPGEEIPFPHEENAVAKIKAAIAAHKEFFNSLAKFCRAGNTRVKIFAGNHDLQLSWPGVQKMIIETISPQNPEKVSFMHEEFENGTYYRHGEEEPHTKSNHAKPIITALEVAKLLKGLGKGKLDFALRDVLDVSMSHYLDADLMYNLKKHNYLLGRMHIHDFVWIDAIKGAFRESWYRDRWFVPSAVFHMSRTFYRYALRPQSWHIEMTVGTKKILQTLYWTFTGVSSGHTPRDSAMKVLRRRPEVKRVVHSHEHEEAFEVTANGTYLNTGTWMPQFRRKKEKLPLPLRKFRQLRKLASLARTVFGDDELELVWKCPVGIETTDDCGEVTLRLAEWDRYYKTLKQLS